MDFLLEQAGVASRPQLLASGWDPDMIRRALRRRELAVIERGVYINHTGEPTWLQRAWAGLLTVSSDVDLDDVALSHHSALRVAEGPGRETSLGEPIHVAVRHDRRLNPPKNVRIHRCRHFDQRRANHRYPPRIRYEEAVLDVAASSSPKDSLALLARVVGDRRTTAQRILTRLRARATIRNRRWLERVLIDIHEGTHSVLEHGFLAEIVRPHGLPVPRRQVREETPIGVAYRDAAYGNVIVELDGRMFHSSFERHSADLDRDLMTAVAGRHTVRLGWGQVFDRPCATAAALNQLLSGQGRPCGPTCALGES